MSEEEDVRLCIYCGDPHHQLENLCGVKRIRAKFSRCFEVSISNPINSHALQVREHNCHLLADVRFGLCLPVAWDRYRDLHLLACFFICRHINCIETHLCFPCATRLVSPVGNMQSKMLFPHFLYACRPSSLEETCRRPLEVLQLSSM